MPTKDLKISVLLSGGIDNRAEPELTQPVVKQGDVLTLRASTNTRLGVKRGGVVRAPKFTSVSRPGFALPAGDPCWGLLPSTSGKTTLQQNLSVQGGYVVGNHLYQDAGRDTHGPASMGYQQSALGGNQLLTISARVDDGEQIGGNEAYTDASVCWNESTGEVWYAWMEFYEGFGQGLFPCFSVYSPTGTRYSSGRYNISPIAYTPGTSINPWNAITSHGANGVRYWYIDTATNQLRMQRVFLRSDTGSITQDAAVNVYAVGSGAASLAAETVDICEGGDSYVYVHLTEGTNTRLLKVRIADGSVESSYVFSGARPGSTGPIAIASYVLGSTRLVAAMVSGSGTTTSMTFDASLVPQMTTSSTDTATRVACGFAVNMGSGTFYGQAAVFLTSIVRGDVATGPWSSVTDRRTVTTRVDMVDLASLEKRYVTEYPYMILQTGVTHWSPKSGSTWPLFAMAPAYSASGTGVGDTNYAEDPSLDVYAVTSVLTSSPVARVGTVRGIAAPVRTLFDRPPSASNRWATIGNKSLLTYVQQSEQQYVPTLLDSRSGDARWVRFDWTGRQPSFATDKDGSTHVAAALPWTWDGREIFEAGGLLHAPRLGKPSDAGAYAPSFPAGAYRYRAVMRWTDATGVTHRSRPSNEVLHTLASTGQLPGVMVTTQTSLSTKQAHWALYMSKANGKTLHLASVATQATWSANIAVVDESEPLLYSTEADGQELAPQAPPPLHDISVIGARLWGIDGEYRTRLVYTKLRVAGFGYEWHPALELTTPSGAGKAMAVRELGGQPIVICESGVFTVSSDGPNNQVGGGGQSFTTPQRVSDVGCTSTQSVASFPGGLMWQWRDRFVLMSGGAPQLLPDFLCTHDVSCTVTLPRYSEVLFFSATQPEIRVYNYEVGKWTTWDSQVLAAPVTHAALMPFDEDAVLVYCQSTGLVYRLDAQSISSAANMTWDTDHVLLGGDFQDHVIVREAVFSGVIAGPHGIEISFWMDYESSPSNVVTWTSAEIAALAVNGRYTLRYELPKQDCRAIRVRVRDIVAPGEANPAGVSPRALTLYYAIDGQVYEEVFTQGSFK